jgi:hypothetical protein
MSASLQNNKGQGLCPWTPLGTGPQTPSALRGFKENSPC